MYKAGIFKMVDLDNSKIGHVSISGGRATHSFYHCYDIKDSTLEGLKAKIKAQFGEAYATYENSMYFAIPENEWAEVECPENYEAIISQVVETPVNV
jgi:hypothetical protein